MQNPFTKIHWIYINLEHRKDRNEQVRKELLEFIPEENIHRIDAIKGGFMGCTKSHIKALEYAKQFDIACILEDDFQWFKKERVWNILNHLFTMKYDVFLGCGSDSRILHSTNLISRVTATGTAHCYIPKKEYIDKIINNFKESIDKNIPLDVYWKVIQDKDIWLGTNPSFSIQRPGFSDIEKRFTDYKNLK